MQHKNQPFVKKDGLLNRKAVQKKLNGVLAKLREYYESEEELLEAELRKVRNGEQGVLGDLKVLTNVTFELPPGAVLGVIGPNGAGKTTLLKIIVGSVKADSGKVELGSTVRPCFVDQDRADLDPAKSVWAEISDGLDELVMGAAKVNSRAYVAKFGFKSSDQQQLVGTLSGGQRNRVQLAKMLRRGGNLLLIDEPTNDLDVATIQVLEDAIEYFPGCAVVVSHDRFFLDKVATHILAFQEDHSWRFWEGNYQSYKERLAAEREDKGLAPETRGTHRRLS